MSTHIPTHHPISSITEDDLRNFANLVPPSGTEILRMLGVKAGLTLLNGLAGVRVVVPKGPCSNAGGKRTWAYLAAVIGVDAMNVLAREMGGDCLKVPTLYVLRSERRNHAIRTQFDRLTAPAPAGEGLSKFRAMQELVLLHAPISCGHLESVLDRPSPEPVAQTTLF